MNGKNLFVYLYVFSSIIRLLSLTYAWWRCIFLVCLSLILLGFMWLSFYFMRCRSLFLFWSQVSLVFSPYTLDLLEYHGCVTDTDYLLFPKFDFVGFNFFFFLVWIRRWIGTRGWRNRRNRPRSIRMRSVLRLKGGCATISRTPPACFR